VTRFPIVVAVLALAFLAGCNSGSSTTPNIEQPIFMGVDSALIGTWRGIPGTSSDLDTARITTDSLVSTWTFPGGGSTTHMFSLGPVALSGAKLYAVAGVNGKAGQMGLSNGQTVRNNVTFEYIFSHDTLLLESQNSDVYDTIVDRTSSSTHALVRVN